MFGPMVCKCFGACFCLSDRFARKDSSPFPKDKPSSPDSLVSSDTSSPSSPQSDSSIDSEHESESKHELLNELALDLFHTLARGSFGTVYGAKLTIQTLHILQEATPLDDWSLDEMASEDTKLIAVKIVSNVDDGDKLRHMWTEESALSLIAHPNIVRHFGYFQAFARQERDSFTGYRYRVNPHPYLTSQLVDERMLFVVFMERLGSSLKAVKARFNIDRFNEREACHIFNQIGSALAYMHETFAVCHNQLCLAKILTTPVGAHGMKSRELFVDFPLKLIHFGEASIHAQFEYHQAELTSARVLNHWWRQAKLVIPDRANVFLGESFNFARMIREASDIDRASMLFKRLRLMSKLPECDRITIADALLLGEHDVKLDAN